MKKGILAQMNDTRDDEKPRYQVCAAYGARMQLRLANNDIVSARGKGKRLRLVCGDWVCAEEIAGETQWLVTERYPRSNTLTRTNNRGGREALAANLDQLLVVLAAVPKPDRFILDRMLGAAHLMNTDTAIVINKVDTSTVEELANDYRQLGYRVFEVSAVSGKGLDQLGSHLDNRVSCLVGQSGVGKSSLTNALASDATLRIGELGVTSQEGKHTTVASTMLELTAGGYLIDSPGVRDFAPHIEKIEQVIAAFPELSVAGQQCRFNNCLHLSEPACAVKDLAEQSANLDFRYRSYRRLLNITKELQRKY